MQNVFEQFLGASLYANHLTKDLKEGRIGKDGEEYLAGFSFKLGAFSSHPQAVEVATRHLAQAVWQAQLGEYTFAKRIEGTGAEIEEDAIDLKKPATFTPTDLELFTELLKREVPARVEILVLQGIEDGYVQPMRQWEAKNASPSPVEASVRAPTVKV